MCGIMGCCCESGAMDKVIEGLEKLEYRGYDSAGAAYIDDGQIIQIKSSGKLENLKDRISFGKHIECGAAMGHTRWATHGEPSEQNAHPHISFTGRFSIVHNGIIENYAELKDMLVSHGVEFKSETDSEVIAQLLDYFYENSPLDTIRKTTNMLSGSYALGILCRDFPDRIFFACRFSPLLIGAGKSGYYIASDASALGAYADKIYRLSDGEYGEAGESFMNVFSSDGALVNPQRIPSGDILSVQGKNGFEHYMLKEIYEQPDVIERTINSCLKNGLPDFSEQFEKIKLDVQKTEKIYVTACGSAYHVGLAARYVIEELCGVPVFVETASEFRYSSPVLNKKTLVILISQSGETADVLAALEKAKASGAAVMSLVNVASSSLFMESPCSFLTLAGREVAVATTKAYSCQLVSMYLLAAYLMLENGADKNKVEYIVSEIKKLPDAVKKIINKTQTIENLALKYHTAKNAFFIGRNVDFAAAAEGALKLKEISYIHAQSYPAGELKHGTISLIETGTPVIAMCAYEPLFKKTLGNALETMARGSNVICVTGEKLAGLAQGTEIFALPDVFPLFSTLPEVVFSQILAYFTAKIKKCDIDMPKNLAKSVTVE